MNYPQIKPTLNLDFSNTKTLDPRINFRRGTPGTYYDGVTHVKAEENLVYPSIPDNNWSASGYTVTTNSTTAPDGTTTASKIVLNNTTTTASVRVDRSVSINNFYTFSIYAKAGEFSVFNLDVTDSVFGDTGINVDLSIGSIIASGSDNISSSITDVGNGWYRIVMVGKSVATGTTGYIIRNVEDTGDGSSGFYLWGAQLEQRDAVTSYTATNGTSITKYQPKLMTAAADNARFDHDPITGESKGLLIEESRTNLLTYSEDFSAWTANNASISPDQIVAPDGGLNGRVLIENTVLNNTHYFYGACSALSGNLTYSVYAKQASGSRYIQLRPGGLGSGIAYANFDVTNGVVVESGAGGSEFVSAEIFDVGNGWYRCIMTANHSVSPDDFILILSNGSGELPFYDGDGHSGVYIWGTQVEAGSFATSYIKTTGASATRSADNASITGENFSSWYRQDEGSVYLEAKYNSGSGERSYQRGVLGFTVNDQNPVTESIIFYNRNGYSSGLGINKNGVYSVLLTGGKLDDFDYFKSSFAYKENDVSLAANVNSGAQLLSDNTCEIPYLNSLTLGAIHEFDDERLNGHIKKLAYYPQRLTNEQLQNLTK